MDILDVFGLALLGACGAFLGWIGFRNDPRLVRHAWERPAMIGVALMAWATALVKLMGVL